MKKSIIIKNLKSTRKNKKKESFLLKFKLVTIAVFLAASIVILRLMFSTNSYASSPDYIWPVRSIDTMKTSRDLARAKLYDPTYDAEIEKQVKIIKSLGANYIAIDTPYDEEFLPFLKRWVKISRDNDLKIWFRGNWSGWEGWFDYPKTITPDEHIQKTKEFIEKNQDLFEDEDIFDSCPECENNGYWPQPKNNAQYNQFLIKKQKSLESSFKGINKQVISNWQSIIGGRAKDVVDKKTFDNLGNVTAIDHYVSDPSNFQVYIDYFKKLKTDLVISEFGAPIPDINGQMSEADQARFVNGVLSYLYSNKANVKGVNYWVLSMGTTSLVNPDYSLKTAANVIKNYYSPGIIKGTLKNSLGEPLENIKIITADGKNTVYSDQLGKYQIVIPSGKTEIIIEDSKYRSKNLSLGLNSKNVVVRNTILNPIHPSFIYNIRLKMNSIFQK